MLDVLALKSINQIIEFKGSPESGLQTQAISYLKIIVGKSRIRHGTALKLNVVI